MSMSAARLYVVTANALSGEIYNEIPQRMLAVTLCAGNVALGVRHADAVFRNDFDAIFNYVAPLMQDAAKIHNSVLELILAANFFDHSAQEEKNRKGDAVTAAAYKVGQFLSDCNQAAIQTMQSGKISGFFMERETAPDPAEAMAKNTAALKDIFAKVSVALPLRMDAASKLSSLWEVIAPGIHGATTEAIEESRDMIARYKKFLEQEIDFIPMFLTKLELPPPA